MPEGQARSTDSFFLGLDTLRQREKLKLGAVSTHGVTLSPAKVKLGRCRIVTELEERGGLAPGRATKAGRGFFYMPLSRSEPG